MGLRFANEGRRNKTESVSDRYGVPRHAWPQLISEPRSLRGARSVKCRAVRCQVVEILRNHRYRGRVCVSHLAYALIGTLHLFEFSDSIDHRSSHVNGQTCFGGGVE